MPNRKMRHAFFVWQQAEWHCVAGCAALLAPYETARGIRRFAFEARSRFARRKAGSGRRATPRSSVAGGVSSRGLQHLVYVVCHDGKEGRQAEIEQGVLEALLGSGGVAVAGRDGCGVALEAAPHMGGGEERDDDLQWTGAPKERADEQRGAKQPVREIGGRPRLPRS